MASLNSVVEEVTQRIRRRSETSRAEYLQHIESWRRRGPRRAILGCTNLAHAYAAVSDESKKMLRKMQQHPNFGRNGFGTQLTDTRPGHAARL